jgi:hypothetical protein
MRIGGGVLLGLAGVLALAADARAEKRYGVAEDLKTFPQATPREALASALKAIDVGKLDYLLAQLAEPEFVDDRVKRLYGGRFEAQVQDTRDRLDPGTVKLLRRFLKDGEWDVGKSEATVRLKGHRDRLVRLARAGGRWYLEHDSSPTPREPTPLKRPRRDTHG